MGSQEDNGNWTLAAFTSDVVGDEDDNSLHLGLQISGVSLHG